MKGLIKTLAVASMLMLCAAPAGAHPGGTNAQGCHTNHSSGAYHCHNRKTPESNRDNYCHVLNGDDRCGYARSTCLDLVKKFGGHCRKD